MGRRTREFYWFQNKVMDKLSVTDLSKNENKYCWALFRKTFGYGVYSEIIKRGYMTKKTLMDRKAVYKKKNRLKERNIIFENGETQGFNLSIERWDMSPLQTTYKNVSSADDKGTPQGGQNVSSTDDTPNTNYEEHSKKVLSKQEEKDRREDFKKHLHDFTKNIGKLPEEKKEKH